MGMGDYPDLGRSSGAKRPRMMWYGDEDLKRNFGDPTGWDFYHTKEVGWDSEAYKNRLGERLHYSKIYAFAKT